MKRSARAANREDEHGIDGVHVAHLVAVGSRGARLHVLEQLEVQLDVHADLTTVGDGKDDDAY